jgi:hypothetical protein
VDVLQLARIDLEPVRVVADAELLLVARLRLADAETRQSDYQRSHGATGDQIVGSWATTGGGSKLKAQSLHRGVEPVVRT